jgi:hypothetical protein
VVVVLESSTTSKGSSSLFEPKGERAISLSRAGIRGALKTFGLVLGKVAAGTFEARVRQLIAGNPAAG